MKGVFKLNVKQMLAFV